MENVAPQPQAARPRIIWNLDGPFLSVSLVVLYTYFVDDPTELLQQGSVLEALLLLWSVLPSTLLGYFIFRHNFLEIAIRRSFGYPVAAVLLLLVYLGSMGYLRDYAAGRVPDEVVQAGMILVLLPLLQPLKRWIDVSIDRLFTRELSRFENLAGRLDGISRSTTDLGQLLRLTEQMLAQELNAKSASLTLKSEFQEATTPHRVALPETAVERFPLIKGDTTVGEILIESQAGKLAQEGQAMLRFISPQIVASIEACRLVEGKIHLERELADRTRMAALGQMAATVAHNIKNPLSSIKTLVQLMQEDEQLVSRYSQDLSLINSEIDRLTNSITQLLKFSKPTAPATANVDVAKVLERTVFIFRPDAERQNIQLKLELALHPLWVRGNEAILSEIFQNLIVNALEVSSARGQVTVRAAIAGPTERRQVQVEVEDDGPGIAPELQQKIFLPFFTTKQKGTGLGLAVVQRRVMDLNGEVACISPISARGGTRFEVRLPSVDEAPPNAQHPFAKEQIGITE